MARCPTCRQNMHRVSLRQALPGLGWTLLFGFTCAVWAGASWGAAAWATASFTGLTIACGAAWSWLERRR